MSGQGTDPSLPGFAHSDRSPPGASCSASPGGQWNWPGPWARHAQHHAAGSAGAGPALLGVWCPGVPGPGAALRAAGPEGARGGPREVPEAPSLCERPGPGALHQGAWARAPSAVTHDPLVLAACHWGHVLGCCSQTHTPEGRVQLEGAGQRLGSPSLCFQYGSHGGA